MKLEPLTAGRVARRLLAFYGNDSKKWTKGWFARSKSKKKVVATSKAAVCWCAGGALQNILNVNDRQWQSNEVLWGRYIEAFSVMSDCLPTDSLAAFNDHCDTFKQFQNKLKEIARLP